MFFSGLTGAFAFASTILGQSIEFIADVSIGLNVEVEIRQLFFFHQPDSQDGSARTLVYFGFSVDFIPRFDHAFSSTPKRLRIWVMIVIEVLSGNLGVSPIAILGIDFGNE